MKEKGKGFSMGKTLFGKVSLRYIVVFTWSMFLLVLLPDIGQCGVDPRFAPLVERLAADGVPADELRRLFLDPAVDYDPDSMGKKMRVLFRTKFVSRTPQPPAVGEDGKKREKIPLYAPHLTEEVLARLKVFRKENAKVLKRASKEYGVPESLILAILVVETKLGGFLGTGTALNVLASMAVSSGYVDIEDYVKEYSPTREQIAWAEERMQQKADWAYKELLALIEYGRQNHLNTAALQGSIYGALGMCQFMPSTALRLGVDGNNDGVVDLYAPPDAIYSVARFLKKAGWKKKLSRKGRIKVIKRYNPDYFYAITVLSVARQL